jgi:hypothetical protein
MHLLSVWLGSCADRNLRRDTDATPPGPRCAAVETVRVAGGLGWGAAAAAK